MVLDELHIRSVLVHARSWYTLGIGTRSVLVHARSWYMLGLDTRSVLVHARSWYMLGVTWIYVQPVVGTIIGNHCAVMVYLFMTKTCIFNSE